jgi:tripartite-type tricarboxylate transporter receptor subunit TctC
VLASGKKKYRSEALKTLNHFVIGVAALVIANAVAAEGYPSRQVRIIVPFAPGGPTDVIARLLAQKLSDDAGQAFFVENHPGAGGNLGTAVVASAPADGYTILVASSSFVVNPSLYKKLPYDPLKDFIPISIIGASPNVLVVNPGVKAKTVDELRNLIKANPGKYTFASPGAGTTPHLSGELFRLSLGLDLVHVPFSGAGPAINSVIGGHTPIGFTALTTAVQQANAGTLRAIAVTGARRSPALPEVPTMAEAGLPDQEASTWQGVLVPAGTPGEIVEFLHRAVVKVVAQPDVKERFAALGFDPVANSPEEFAAQVKVEIAKWGKVIREADIKAE